MRTQPFVLLVVLVGTVSPLGACEPCCPERLDITIHDVEPHALPERIPVAELRTLELVNVRLSAERLDDLLTSTRVRAIRIEGCPVGDDVCAVLARHSCLVEVSLVGTRVTDEGLAMLARLDRLHSVDLRGTRVTRDGVSRFLATSGVNFVDLRGTGIGRDTSHLAVRTGLRILVDEPLHLESRVVSATAEPSGPGYVSE